MTTKYLTLPDLGLGDQPITLSMWLVKAGRRVEEGEPVVEVMAEGVTVDLPAPTDGILLEKFVLEGDALAVGQTLALISEPNNT